VCSRWSGEGTIADAVAPVGAILFDVALLAVVS